MATKLTNDRDPVEVAADALMDRAWNGVESWRRSIWPVQLRDAIATALRTEATRAGEAMREAAARWHENEAAEIRTALAAGAPDLGCGRALHDVHKGSAHAIRTLPLADRQGKPDGQ